jgi:thiamine biosynthesis lipoprotein ApbE
LRIPPVSGLAATAHNGQVAMGTVPRVTVVADDAAGATAVYLDFGGSSQLAFGTMESGDPWTLALAGLEPGVSHGLMRLEGALSTSRSRPVGDETGPIVDPHTGRAVTDPRFATCYAATATQAEACSKAFIVMGWTASRR